jgi:hypothetical protein
MGKNQYQIKCMEVIKKEEKKPIRLWGIYTQTYSLVKNILRHTEEDPIW